MGPLAEGRAAPRVVLVVLSGRPLGAAAVAKMVVGLFAVKADAKIPEPVESAGNASLPEQPLSDSETKKSSGSHQNEVFLGPCPPRAVPRLLA